MGFFSKIVRSVTKPFKKIIKSPLGKAALIGGLGYLATPGSAGMWNPAGKGQWWKGLMMGTPGQPITGAGATKGILGGLKAGWANMGPTAKALTIGAGVGLGTSAASKRAEEEEPSWAGDSGQGHADYLRARKLWDWGDQEPMFSANQGGRVGAQQGMYAGQGLGSLQGAEAGMSQVNQPANQGVLEQASMTTDQGQSEDSELIMLIQQLAAMGIPLEQLRGRTKEELVEMMVYLSSQAQRETGEVEEVITAADGGRVEVGIGGLLKRLKNIFSGQKTGYAKANPNVIGTKDPDVLRDRAMTFFKNKLSGEDEEDIINVAQGGRVGLDLGGQSLERNPGANEIFLDQSTEVLRGGQDGDSIVEETENIEVAEGGMDMGSIALAFKQQFGYDMSLATPDIIKKFIDDYKEKEGWYTDIPKAEGGLMRTGYALGQPVIPSKDGMQLDMRDSGGYQPHGAKEKKDDVRALLAQGEFVMTSDAVRGLGGGNREVGAKKMYDMMHNLEAMA
jgi:hypothetical protein